jgi:hypothetical protein
MYRIKNMNEVLTGTFLILVAFLAFYLTWPLSNVTDVGLGPGFVPNMFAVIQVGLGVMLIVSGFLKEDVASEPWQLRPLVILVAIAFFGVTIERMGLVVSLTGLVLIACTAHRGTKIYEALGLAFGSVVVSSLLFVKALGLSIPLWPPTLLGN